MSSPSVATQPEPRLPERGGRFLVVSDRLPIALTRGGGEGWRAAPVSGALISALTPVLRRHGGVWIGWPGVAEEEVPALREVLGGAIQGGGYSLRPVSLSRLEQQNGLGGFGGEVLWPLFHDLQLECNFDPAYWQAYRRVNRKFARAVAKALSRGGADFLWVHDHQLMHVATELRQLGVTARAAFFLHIPFPSPDIFVKLPWRQRLLAGLLAFDQVGFQTSRDLANFLDCVRLLAPGVEVRREPGELWRLRGATPLGGCDLRAGAFPIGIDCRDFAARAARPEVTAKVAALRAALGGRKLVLGVDRLDRAKGIPEKLRAFAEALARCPGIREQVCLFQVVVPSRDDLARHAVLRAEIERLVGEINGRFGRPGWVPVHYFHRALAADDLLAHYRAADVAMVTSLKEGMNLVAKEYCAASLDDDGVLVLSEFAGAAEQLDPGALLVNPCDAKATARALLRALRMGDEERARRMRMLRANVRRHDVYHWVDSFLATALTERWEVPGAPASGLRSYV
jgi:alpha,alpha-trehalose-phosphate synthase [UDP-forming]